MTTDPKPVTDRFKRIENIVAPFLPPDVLREFYVELERFDTEAKQEILNYARALT